jgi:hydrogenase maturation protein HypF
MPTLADAAAERQAIRVRGAVQGVGFRPFVYRLAHELGLTGWVVNDAEGVLIEAQGQSADLALFTRRLKSDAPPLSRVAQVDATSQASSDDVDGFCILPSRPGQVTTSIPPDTAPCADCLAELFDPADRRYRHAFINCTQCGPRYTLTRALPYDRAQTSMAAFAQCPQCLTEYRNPTHRRFHAEPNACPRCGPQLALVDGRGQPIADDAGDPIAATLALLRAGKIVAIKGLGGFHLACDARNAGAVAELRARKHRDEKPFALMVANLASATAWGQASATEQALLQSAERPVVLLPKRQASAASLPGVAPDLQVLGLMLPCTPMQHLLFFEAAGRPAGTAWLDSRQDLVLVMTSANPGGEPLVIANPEALSRLQGIADAFLLHDRDIVARCDDSVLRVLATGAPQFIRRARGFTPRPIQLPIAGPSVLATGAWLKNTVCITRGDEAFLSPHVGDLDNAATCGALVEMVDHLCAVLDVRPQAVAHDLHPDFFSTRFALEFAAARSLPVHAVQHHHAHVAAVAAEHCATGPLLGLALDGIGLGLDGAAWGGELLRVDGADVERLGHLAPIAMPGGDAAAREPWRMAAAALHQIGQGGQIATRFPRQAGASAVAQMLARGLRCPPTSSAGRWFDAAVGLLGVREASAYEGQAAMLLEALAGGGTAQVSPSARGELVAIGPGNVLDPTPLITTLAGNADPAQAAHGAALFHHALADGLARWVISAATATKLRRVALGGGCFLNALLTALLVPRLQAAGLQVLQARQAPPNDGGIALGQAWVAICRQNHIPPDHQGNQACA